MTLVTMTARTETLGFPDPVDPAACSRWLQDRYMKSERDDDFMDALHEILETDVQGNLPATPLSALSYAGQFRVLWPGAFGLLIHPRYHAGFTR
jgi:hypothetical protein